VAPIHLAPTAPLAERVLLPGDPGRALRLAQWLLDEPRMFNHNRGLWGYTGTAADGTCLSIQSTGMGGPSAAIVISELIDLGARTLIRVGTCGSLVADLELGALLVAGEALCLDGTSRALGAEERTAGDAAVTAALTAALEQGPACARMTVSTDLFYDPREPEAGWRAAGAAVVEMEAATLFTLARRREVAAGALLLVSDTVLPRRRRLDLDGLKAGEELMGHAAARALARLGTSPGGGGQPVAGA
jgi:uridine phosphorylase